MQFSLMFFSCSEDTSVRDKYGLIVDSTRFGDRHGFSSVWIPERHFTQFGSLYPNPAVLQAALARETQQIKLRSGSVVLPLHNPIRVAEEWAMVDNLSGGRVGISVAPGWNPDDFTFFPEKYHNRYQELFEGIETVRQLWRGESVLFPNGTGDRVKLNIYPRPIQPELPIWVTVARNPQNFAKAGEMGTNLLTHLLDQGIEPLAEKIALYRQARAKHGHDPNRGIVTVMLHTFVGENADLIREQARSPYCQFLKSNAGLAEGLAQSRGYSLNSCSQGDAEELLNALYERFAASRGLIGTPENCLELLEKLYEIGVDEVACLLDFGQERELILENLPHLNRLKELFAEAAINKTRPLFKTNSSLEIALQQVLEEDKKAEDWDNLQDSLAEIQARCTVRIPGKELYSSLNDRGAELKESYQGIEELWLGQGEALGKVTIPQVLASSVNDYTIHPCLLDACNQVLAGLLLHQSSSANESSLYLPVGIESLQIHREMSDRVWSQAIVRQTDKTSSNSIKGDLRIFDELGNLLVEVSGLQIKKTNSLSLQGNVTSPKKHCVDWFYDLQWQAKSIEKATSDIQHQTWLIFADHTGVGEKLAENLRELGKTCFLVFSGESYSVSQSGIFSLNPTQPEEMQILLDRVLESTPEIAVVHLWNLDVTSIAEMKVMSIASSLNLLQTLANKSNSSPIWFATKGAQPIENNSISLAVNQAPVWGLGRVAEGEFSSLWGGLIDLDPNSSIEENVRQLIEAITSPDQENQIAYRDGQRYVPRLAKVNQLQSKAKPLSILADATYLITGGLGGIGLKVAAWMVEQGARHLVLVGRSEPKDQNAIAELENKGAKVLVAQADVTDAEAIAGILAEIDSSLPPLKGIAHLAAILDDAMLVKENWEHFTHVSAPKIEGAWNLHSLTQDMSLDFFLMFSSAASLFASMPGQGNYVAANTFLDMLAHYRRNQGLTALTINWGPWSEVGHGATDYGRQAHARAASYGITSLSVDKGLQVLEELLLNKNVGQIGVIPVDWSQFFQADSTVSTSPLFSQLIDHETVKTRNHNSQILEQLEAASDRLNVLVDYLQTEIAYILRIDSSQLDRQEALTNMGLDSLLAVELRNQLKTNLKIDIAIAKFLEDISIFGLAAEIDQQIDRDQTEEDALSISEDLEESNLVEGVL